MLAFLISIFLLLAFPQTSSIDTKSILNLLESRYRTAHTLQATFLETYTENGRPVRVEAGTAFFHKPGKMRWEYQSPEKNLFLVDGKMAWFYVPADHTVTRVPAKQSSDWRTPLALLAGEMKLSRICSKVLPATDEKPQSPAHAIFSCTLRAAASSNPSTSGGSGISPDDDVPQSVYLEVLKETGELSRIIVRDPGGLGIEFNFKNWRFDPPVQDTLFHFSPPPGVAIVNGLLPSESREVTR